MIIYEEILRSFQREKVRYVIVGGIAFNLLGGLRNTSDLDILVEMSDGNLAKVVKIFKKQGFGVKQPVNPMDIADNAIRRDWIENKHMKAFNFYKDGGLLEVDIIVESPVSYKEARKDAVIINTAGIRLPVISINHLIKMKKKAGRNIDILDISELKVIKNLRKRNDKKMGK